MPLDERIQRLSDTIIEEVRSPIEEALRHLLTDVMEAASGDCDQAVQSAVAVAGAQHQTSLAALREDLGRDREVALADLRARLDHDREAAMADLRAALERERDEAVARLQDELTRDHEAALEARAAALDQDLEQARRDAEQARRDAEQASAEIEQARQEIEQARQGADQARQDAEQARQDAERVRSDAAAAEQARRDEVEARQAAEQARYAAEQATQAAEHARQDAEHARQDAEQRQLAAHEDLHRAHAADRQLELACSDRTLAAFRRLDDARSLSEVLRVLADQAEAEIGRAAVLLVTGSRLRGWESRNLPAADASALDVPVNPESVFGQCIASGLPASTSDAPLGSAGDTLAAVLAAPPGRAGLAVPISVGGRVVAILYADDAGDRTPLVPSAWPELAEILARHAGRCLELLTISHASVLAGRAQEERGAAGGRQADLSPFADERREEESARRYARLLISEIKLYNEAAVEQGRAERDLWTRLGPDIERARRLYEEKIPAAVRRRVDCFDQEVLRTLAGGDAGLLGQR
jgi:chemotaxis protein histidine kinase CheA